MLTKKGIPVSPGIAIAQAMVLDLAVQDHRLRDSDAL